MFGIGSLGSRRIRATKNSTQYGTRRTTENMIIWHNPRCSKSRQTLSLLQEKGVEPEIRLYLDSAPSESELELVVKKLGMTTRDLLRKGEQIYKEQGLSDSSLSDSALIQKMCEYPKLIERPIVISGNRAVLGRPPENALKLCE